MGVCNMKQYYVYIITNKKNGTLYIGRTENIARRIYEHKQGFVAGFSKRYNLKRLIYLEIFENSDDAAKREKSMKAWNRQWKINLIEKDNPNWVDLYDDIVA